jgi:hypothetical protein
VPVPDSGAWESSVTVLDALAGDYDLVFSENYGGCEIRVMERFTIVTSDTEPPTVSWVKPVGNREIYPTARGTVELEVSVTDNADIRLVEFVRWDAVNSQFIRITTDSSPAYQASVEVNTLNRAWNQITAVAEDTAGNLTQASLLIYRLMPMIILDLTEGPRDTQVTVQGSGWLPGDTVFIHFAIAANKVAQATVDNEGSFVTKFTVPTNAAIGEQKVIAITANGTWEAGAIFQVTEPGQLSVIEALGMSNTNPLVGKRVSTSFKIKNMSGSALHLEKLTAAVRRGSDWDGEQADFPHVSNITLQPNEEYSYRQSRSFDTAGEYFVQPVVKINGHWGGIENANRVSFMVIAPKPVPTPTPPISGQVTDSNEKPIADVIIFDVKEKCR